MQQAADLAVAAPTIAASLDGRYMSALRVERIAAAKVFEGKGQQMFVSYLQAGDIPKGSFRSIDPLQNKAIRPNPAAPCRPRHQAAKCYLWRRQGAANR